jgi:predicted transcriptional regulator
MIVVQYVLPALRVLIMKDLMENYDMRKTDAAAIMKLTPAAITQYAKGERGGALATEIAKSEETMRILSELAKALVENTASQEIVIEKLCKACMTLRSEGICACASLTMK